MSNFQEIQRKLHQFINKFYVNELIKGVILFITLGFLYLLFTLFIEYFLWLKPTARTILFWVFVLVEVFLFFKYIAVPISKLGGLKKGLSQEEASVLIGRHFPEVKDKLLNIIQLKYQSVDSELIEASIQQKSTELKFVPFKSAVKFSTNKKYVKYIFLPIIIWLLVFATGNIKIFDDSLTRVVNYKKEYIPPAPFSFVVLNNSFEVLEGASIELDIKTIGDVVPEDAKIYFSNENYYLKNNGFGKFSYNFSNVRKNIDFYVESNGITSHTYQIKVIPTPIISKLKMVLNYPGYTGKEDEVIQNTGNALIPQGTEINWQIETHQTDAVNMNFETKKNQSFIQNTNNYFSYSTQVFSDLNYGISTSNAALKNHEHLKFKIEVIPDEFPKILIQTNIDSISYGPAEFIGQLTDDYGVKKLELEYYNTEELDNVKHIEIPINRSTISEFYYVFPDGIEMKEGVNYEFYFKVFDNDAVNGNKFSKSKKYSYYRKTTNEFKELLLKEQQQNLEEMSKSVQKAKENNQALKQFKEELQKKGDLQWNDSKKLEEFIERQKKYDEMFEEKTNELQENLNEQPVSKSLEEKKKELQKRVEEIKKIANQEKLEKELEDVLNKIDKEDLVKKLEKLSKKSNQKEQSLERILELTKRFYIEQKANQLADELKKLADEQENIGKEEGKNETEEQEEINKEFNKIADDLKSLQKENESLKRSMKLPKNEEKQDEIKSDLEKALNELKKKNQKGAKPNQKKAKKKMMDLAKEMESAMQAMEGEMIDENIEDLRKIVENLIEFSFQQEDLFNTFNSMEKGDPTFPKSLKKQQLIKNYFEHIDDSLYVLSLRMVKMGALIQQETANIHQYLDGSLANFSENLFEEGRSNQRFVITGANNLANNLSDLLESMMNASPSMGQGKSGDQEFSLPDVIKKQGDLKEKMEQGMKEGKSGKEGEGEKGKNKKPGESSKDGELFQIYKEQYELRKQLEELLNNSSQNEGSNAAKVLRKMEEIELELIEKGFSNQLQKQLADLQYELLKLDSAKLEQGKDKKRESIESNTLFEKRSIDSLMLKNKYFNYNEILKRQSLPLRSIYKKKVQEYFKQ